MGCRLTVLILVPLMAVLLAGCADDGLPDAAGQAAEPVNAPQLVATETTGVLRGLVVDEAIRPIRNVTVQVNGPSGARSTETDLNGFFGFQDLAPGAYIVRASKLAYEAMQQTADVAAAVDDPPLVRLQLTFLPSEQPFHTEFRVQGYIACIVPGANLCFIANYYPCMTLQMAGQTCTGNATNDNSVFDVYDPIVAGNRIPSWSQVEMVWDSTQPLTDWLQVRHSPVSPEQGGGIDDRAIFVTSPSPLLVTINETVAADWELGTVKGLRFETFSGGNDMTCGGLPVRACLGTQVNQQVDYYFHFFFGYQPPEGWRFSETQSVPPRPSDTEQARSRHHWRDVPG